MSRPAHTQNCDGTERENTDRSAVARRAQAPGETGAASTPCKPNERRDAKATALVSLRPGLTCRTLIAGESVENSAEEALMTAGIVGWAHTPFGRLEGE